MACPLQALVRLRPHAKLGLRFLSPDTVHLPETLVLTVAAWLSLLFRAGANRCAKRLAIHLNAPADHGDNL